MTEESARDGGDATDVVADVTDRDDGRETAEAATAAYGGFDTCVNVAGAFVYGRLEDTPAEDMRRQFETKCGGCRTDRSRPPTT